MSVFLWCSLAKVTVIGFFVKKTGEDGKRMDMRSSYPRKFSCPRMLLIMNVAVVDFWWIF